MALRGRKLRAPFRSERHRKVLRTRRISGDICAAAKSVSELTRVSARFREHKRVHPTGFEPVTFGSGGSL